MSVTCDVTRKFPEQSCGSGAEGGNVVALELDKRTLEDEGDGRAGANSRDGKCSSANKKRKMRESY